MVDAVELVEVPPYQSEEYDNVAAKYDVGVELGLAGQNVVGVGQGADGRSEDKTDAEIAETAFLFGHEGVVLG